MRLCSISLMITGVAGGVSWWAIRAQLLVVCGECDYRVTTGGKDQPLLISHCQACSITAGRMEKELRIHTGLPELIFYLSFDTIELYVSVVVCK